ncbi:MAG: diguanylate cyclase [Planctomycetes bacterium]|nr:diguanylate cyclase [Planctomycetota bacterium]
MIAEPASLPRSPVRVDSPLILGKDRGELASRVFVEGWRGLVLAAGGFALVAVIAGFDYLMGPELSFAIFYLVPIAVGAWWGGFAQGILLSMACALSWQFVEIAGGSTAAPVIQLWNGTARFGIFVITSSLLSRLRLSLFFEKKLARSDPLTGAANGRTFYETVSQTVARLLRTRQPLTLAYLDLDNFKWLNDKLGHSAGDEALCDLVRTIHHNIRGTDLLARLGGDEFALLLPEASEEDARAILERIQACFNQQMGRKQWPVTLSIGAMTFPEPICDVDAMVRRVDELMYQAKKAGKNRIVHHQMRDSELEVELAQAKVLERRATARVVCDRPARVRSESDEDGVDEFARVRDISASGLCLHLERALPEQTLLAIEPLHECGTKTLLVRVMWSVPQEGGWLHECVLPNRLSAEELALWVTEQSAESCHDCE